MAAIQAFYAFSSMLDPGGFAEMRGTALQIAADADWVVIYGSRTLFIALFIGLLLFLRQYALLKWAALIGMVMPIIDAWLALQAEAETSVVIRHVATAVYLLLTFAVLHHATRKQSH